MPDPSGLGDGAKLPGGLGDTVGSATTAVSGLVNDVISAGAGGTITQGMVDRANTIKPKVDQANG
ncbi:hypothetical protein [Streptomyces europaeiscabiei]|uniref:hypothetical protein n=1 Tax=Streptomyces europaeiscabiei TaxID=146819 RepID=UPI002E1680D7|nr:hypothetical protein OHB30_45480 [Streptomyces europaeiscabiei]